MVTRGRTSAQASAGQRGRRPLRVARGRAAGGACPSSGPAGPPSPKGEGKGCCWRRRKVSRGVGDAAPYGLPGEGRQGEPAPHPALRGHLPPRGKARVVVEGFIPPGVSAAAEGRGGVGAPRPTDGDMEALWGLRGHPFPGRRAVGAGHARPGGLRGHLSMVRSVGRGLDPSAGRRGRRPLRFARERAAAGGRPSSGPAGPPSPKGEGKGCSGGIHPSRGVGGGGPRRGGRTTPYGWGYGNAREVYADTRFRAAAR